MLSPFGPKISLSFGFIAPQLFPFVAVTKLISPCICGHWHNRKAITPCNCGHWHNRKANMPCSCGRSCNCTVQMMPFPYRLPNVVITSYEQAMHRVRMHTQHHFGQDRNSHFHHTRTFADDRRIGHNFAVRCKYCSDFSWPRYEYHRKTTNTYEYYCETCWLWWQRHVYDFRLKTLAKTLPNWMLSTDDQRYNLLLGGDIGLKALRKRKRQRYLYLLLSTSGHLKELQDMMSPTSVQWDCKSIFVNRIIDMIVHGEPNLYFYQRRNTGANGELPGSVARVYV